VSANPAPPDDAARHVRRLHLSNHCVERYIERAGAGTPTIRKARNRLRALIAERGRISAEAPPWFAPTARGARLFVVLDIADDQLVLPLMPTSRAGVWQAVTTISRKLALSERGSGDAWTLAGMTRFSPGLLEAFSTEGESRADTARRLRRLLASDAGVSPSAPSWVPRPMVAADVYLEIPHTVALAARWEDDRLGTADWWLPGHDPRSGPYARPGHGPEPLPVLVVGAPPPAELQVDRRAFGRYFKRVDTDGANTFEDFERLVRAGKVLAEPPRWMLFRPPNVALLVLVGEDPEANTAWVATAVRHDDGHAVRLVVTSCVGKAWYEGGGLAGKRALRAITPHPPELLRWVAPPGADLEAEWSTFRSRVGEEGAVVPTRPAQAPNRLTEGDAYLVLAGSVVASLAWSGHRLTVVDVVTWPLDHAATGTSPIGRGQRSEPLPDGL
jgi:hypothetical protein